MSFKVQIKKKLRKNLFFFNIILFLYKLVNFPKNLFKKFKSLSIKKKAFQEYERNSGILKINYAGYDLKFKAISAKNYYHLITGSQNEHLFFKKLFNKISDGMVVYDIGGHVGMYTLPFAKIVGKNGKVFVFEPDKNGYEAIKVNLDLNNIENVKLFDCAMSDKSDLAEFFLRPDKDTHSLFEETLAPSKTGAQKKINVQSYTIDDLILRKLAPPPNFIKIDTEGAELKILNGIKKNYSSLNYIFIEIHPNALKLENILNPEEKVEEKLKEIGFNKFEYYDNIHLLAMKGD
tara:strand:- start:1344 stop:2216 length:873 start_codon:yes stop_codon:yes gene_type:complete